MKLQGLLFDAGAITPARCDEMFRLMLRCFANVTWEAFTHDLSEKRWVILLLNPDTQELCGFSTQMLITLPVDGAATTALFSGDTIVAPEHWGDTALSHVFGNLALDLIDQHPPDRLFWFLISKGYKTYRFLPVFFREFYPRHDTIMPARMGRLLDAFGRHKFPQTYDPSRRIIRANEAKDHLRAGVADLTEARLRDPHVAFFAQANPRHAAGEELCCLAPLTRANFTAAAYRVILGTNGVAGPNPKPEGGDK